MSCERWLRMAGREGRSGDHLCVFVLVDLLVVFVVCLNLKHFKIPRKKVLLLADGGYLSESQY